MSESSAERETAPPEEEAVPKGEAGSEDQAGSGAEAGSGAAAPTDEVVTSGAVDSGSGAPGESETADEAERSRSEQNSTAQVGTDQTGAERSDQQSEPDDPEQDRSKLGQPEQDLPETLTFRITRTTLLAVISFTVCATPVASAQPWLLWVYLFPLAALVWVLRVRTTVSAEGVRVRTLTGTTRVSWDDVQSVKLDSRRWVEAVLTSGERVKLPAVRVRDLSRLSAMSRGRIPDPAR